MKKILFTAIILSSFFVGCKKKEDKPTTAQTRTQLLTAHNWLMTAQVASAPGESEQDMFSVIENCTKDDLIKFNTNFTFDFDEGATKCSPSDQQTASGVWSFNSDETMLTVEGATEKIEILNATQLKISFIGIEDGVSYTVTTTYSKK